MQHAYTVLFASCKIFYLRWMWLTSTGTFQGCSPHRQSKYKTETVINTHYNVVAPMYMPVKYFMIYY